MKENLLCFVKSSTNSGLMPAVSTSVMTHTKRIAANLPKKQNKQWHQDRRCQGLVWNSSKNRLSWEHSMQPSARAKEWKSPKDEWKECAITENWKLEAKLASWNHDLCSIKDKPTSPKRNQQRKEKENRRTQHQLMTQKVIPMCLPSSQPEIDLISLKILTLRIRLYLPKVTVLRGRSQVKKLFHCSSAQLYVISGVPDPQLPRKREYHSSVKSGPSIL